MLKKKRNIHEMYMKLEKLEGIINDEKRKNGYSVGISLDEKSTRSFVKDFLNLNHIPNREETRELIMDITENNELYKKFIDRMVYLTNEITEANRLEMTEIAIIENLNLLEKEKVKILDIGVGGTYSNELKAITTIELVNKLTKEKINFEMYGGDVRINNFENINGINLFPLDMFKVKESMINFHKEFGFNKFDIIRCSNLLGHFQQKKKNIIINNLIELSEQKSLILFNPEYEKIYTLYVKDNNEIETRLIY